MKDEYDVGGGDKLIIGTKMKTVLGSIHSNNPTKPQEADILFNYRSLATRVSSIMVTVVGKVKRGPGKGRVIKTGVYASTVLTMKRVFKARKTARRQSLTPEEMTRRQMQLHRDSYRLSSAMNSGDLK